VQEWQAAAEIPATRYGPRAARETVAALLFGWGLGSFADDAQLVVSELVTNAYLHTPASRSFELGVLVSADSVRLSVADRSNARPVVGEINPTTQRGRGLRLVEAVSDRWGVDSRQAGKSVWAELT
jgi:anti-sigma regulatory factor (Ser/Thr protein kinase)